MDVVIEGDVAWVVGASSGNHEQAPVMTRGILVPMDLHTGEVVAPVIVAPKSGPYTQSAFFGAGHHPLGVLVTGYGCDDGVPGAAEGSISRSDLNFDARVSPVASPPKHVQPPHDVLVEREKLPSCISRREVPTPAAKHRVQVADEHVHVLHAVAS